MTNNNNSFYKRFIYGSTEETEIHVMISSILFFTMVLYICLLRYFFSNIRLRPPSEPVLFLSGILIGNISPYIKFEESYADIVHGNLTYWRPIVIPLMLYKICVYTDFHKNPKIFVQALSFGVLGLIISACLIGSAIHITEGNVFPLGLSFLFGMVYVPVYPAIAIGQQKLFNTSYSQVGKILEGESLVATVTGFFLLDLFLRPKIDADLEILLLITAGHLVAGALVGWIFGLLLRKLVGLFSEPPIMIMITFFIPLSCYAWVYYLGLNENLAFIVQVITVCKRRTSFRKDVHQIFIKLITVVGTIFTDTILVYIGIFLAEEFVESKVIIDIPFILCMYIIGTCGRFFSYAVLSMVLSKFDHGLSLPQMALAIWCGVPSIINIFMAFRLFYHYHSDIPNYGESLPCNISCVTFLGYVINVWTTPLILNRLDHSPLARDVNMDTCFQHIMDTRNYVLLKLKLDRMFSDAHWFKVKEVTVITIPQWTITSSSVGVEENFRFAVCNNCNLEFSVSPTYKEYQEMSREARKRVVNARKNSYVRKHESGMLSIESCRTLIKAADESLGTPDIEFSIEPIMRTFKKVSMMEAKRKKLFNSYEYAFSIEHADILSAWQKRLALLIVNPCFDIVINIIVICHLSENMGCFLFEPNRDLHLRPKSNAMFGSIYLTEMAIKIYILTLTRRFSCVYNYFRCIWNTIDSVLTILTVLACISEFAGSHRHFFLIITSFASLRVVRLLRLLQLIKACKKNFTYFSRRYENFIAYQAYEVGKTFVKGEQELMLTIPGMVNDTIITEEILTDIERDVTTVTAELSQIQRNLPQAATNFKTKQAIRSILNNMSEEIDQIKISGWIEEHEHTMLKKVVYDKYRILDGLTNVEWNSPKTLFHEIPWLKDHNQSIETLYSKVQIINYAPNETVIDYNQVATGVYLLLVGLLKLEYTPSKFVIDQMETYGALPIVDYIATYNFKAHKTDFMGSGNTFGELSILTGRPYSCKLVADSVCQMYYLKIADIKQAMLTDNDSIFGLESRMWKSISSGLALHILTTSSPYRTIPPEEVRLFLDRCFMPNLSKYSKFEKSSRIDDIILIEGAILDEDTEEYFIAPRHIPRTVYRIALPGSKNYALNTTIEVRIIVIMKLNVKPETIWEEILMLNDREFTTIKIHPRTEGKYSELSTSSLR